MSVTVVNEPAQTVQIVEDRTTVALTQEVVSVVTVGIEGPPGPPSLSPDGVITAEGDLIIGGTGGTPEALAATATGQELIFNGTRPAYHDPEVIRLSRLGILPDTGADLTAQIQAVIDDHPGQTILFDRPGTYLANTVTTASSLPWILAVTTDHTGLHGVRGAWLQTTQDAYLLIASGMGKPSGMASWASSEFVDATVYGINTASKHAMSVTCSTASDAGNFAAGDWVILRTGQTLGTGTGQPDGEINQVVSADAGTGVVTLRSPLCKSYAQEYFITGTSGYTSTAVTANAAAFGIAKVTDRVLDGFSLHGLGLKGLAGTRGLINTSQMVNYTITDCDLHTATNLMGAGGSCNAKWLRNRVVMTGTGSAWHFATDKFCSDIEIAHNHVTAARVGTLHLHEGSSRIHVHNNTFLSGQNVTASDNSVSVRTRAYDLVVENNIIGGSGFLDGIRIDALSPGGGTIRGNTILGNPTNLVTVLSSGWSIDGNRPESGRINYSVGSPGVGTATNLASGGPAMGQQVCSIWVADDYQTSVVGIVPAHAVVDAVRVQVQQAFNSDGTDQVTVGTDSDASLFATAVDVSTTGVKTVTPGTGVGLYSGTAQTVKAFYTNGGSEPTTGRALIEVFWHRVSTQVP